MIISTTLHHTTAEVRSHFGGAWSNLIRQRIESYGVGKFEGNSETVSCGNPFRLHANIAQSRKGMSLILSLLRNRQPLPETAEFEFYPPPPPGFNESWKDIPEAGSSQRKEGSPRSFFLSPGSLAAWARTKRANGESEQDSGSSR